MTDTTQNDLARERTHAAWLRTALAFIVATIVSRHYIDDNPFFVWSLGLCGVATALRAAKSAADASGVVLGITLAMLSVAAVITQIH